MTFNTMKSSFSFYNPIFQHSGWVIIRPIYNKSQIFKFTYIFQGQSITLEFYIHINLHYLGFINVYFQPFLSTKFFKSK